MRKLLFLFIMLSCIQINAQEPIKVNSDRPDEADATYIIEQGYLQVEQGFFFEREISDSLVRTYGLQDVTLRLGLLPKIELQVLYSLINRDHVELKTKAFGIGSAKLGLKYSVGTQKGVLPSFSVYGNMSFPSVAGKEFRTDHKQYTFALLFQNELRNAEISYNVGFNKEKNTPFEWVYAICLSKDFNEKLSGYIEHYSHLQKNETELSFDSGLGYTVNDLLILDVAAGITVNQNIFFFTVGLSYLIPKKLF